VILVPSYALAATAIGTPGMRFHLEGREHSDAFW
jgi:hypothetical protein